MISTKNVWQRNCDKSKKEFQCNVVSKLRPTGWIMYSIKTNLSVEGKIFLINNYKEGARQMSGRILVSENWWKLHLLLLPIIQNCVFLVQV